MMNWGDLFPESIFTVVHEVAIQGQAPGQYGAKERRELEEEQTVNVNQLEDLEKLAKTKIEEWANTGALATHRKLINILYRWKHWGGQNDVDNFVRQLVGDDHGLVTFITAFLQKSTSQGMSDYVKRVHWRIHIDSVKEFISIDEAEPRIRKIVSSKSFETLNNEEKLAIKTFLLGTASAYSQETKSIPPPPIAFVVKLGMSDDGAVTSEWIEAIRQRHNEEALSAIPASKKRLSEEEALWAGLVKRKVSTWIAMIDSLQIPEDFKKRNAKN